eukprot:6868069-Lingulodinium_polyedra.AAC.1
MDRRCAFQEEAPGSGVRGLLCAVVGRQGPRGARGAQVQVGAAEVAGSFLGVLCVAGCRGRG